MDNFNNQSIISIDVNNKNHGISLEKLNPSLEIIIKTEKFNWNISVDFDTPVHPGGMNEYD